MIRKQRPLAALALVATALLISACGSTASAGTGTGSSGANNAPAGAGSNTTASRREKGVRFAKCMRAHGVSAFPDPGASGQLTIDGIANGSSLNPSTPAFAQAISACKHLEPAGFTGSRRSSQQQDAALKFAQCIREDGVKDFPDPVPNGPLVDTNRIPSSATSSGMRILNAAMQKCRDAAAAAGVTR